MTDLDQIGQFALFIIMCGLGIGMTIAVVGVIAETLIKLHGAMTRTSKERRRHRDLRMTNSIDNWSDEDLLDTDKLVAELKRQMAEKGEAR